MVDKLSVKYKGCQLKEGTQQVEPPDPEAAIEQQN